MKHFFKFISVLVAVVAVLSVSVFTVSADSFKSYTYDSDNMAVEAPSAVNTEYSATGDSIGAGAFSSPQDVFMSEEGLLYLADKGNNRIVIMTDDLRSIGEIKEFENGEASDSFSEPSGVYVRGPEIYICDSGNSRVVVLNKDLSLKRIITLTKGDSLPADFVFKPIKLSVDTTGRIFVVSDGFSNGLLEFTPEGEYVRYMGAAKVSLTPLQMFWRIFSTREQREKTTSNVSAVYNNVEVDDEGFLYATSSAFSYWQYVAGLATPIVRLNAKGSDVLSGITPYGDTDYPDAKTVRATYTGPSTLVDVCTLPYGSYAVLDRNRGRVFAYSSDGELMYEFGGPGNINGGMTVPTALEFYNNKFYTVDSGKNQINVYSLTEYGLLFGEVAKASEALDYAREEALWNEIVNKNANCTLAMRGLGNAAYRRQDMSTAMHYFELARDTEGYSKAYVFVRRELIEDNAIWLLLIAAVIVTVIIFAVKGFKKLVRIKGTRSFVDRLDFSGFVVFHPIKGFWELKREKRGSVASGLTIFAIAIIVKIASSVATGFLFNPKGADDYSMLTDIGLMLGILLLWSVSQWCVTVLMSGEGRFGEILTATCYSFTPYIFMSVLALAASQVLSLDEAELYTVFMAIGVVYTAFLMFMSIIATHDYSVKKAVIVTVIMLVVILLVLFIALLLITLTQQMVSFVTDLYNEITLRI